MEVMGVLPTISITNKQQLTWVCNMVRVTRLQPGGLHLFGSTGYEL